MAGWKDLHDDNDYSQEDLKEVEEQIELMEEDLREKIKEGRSEEITLGDKLHLRTLRRRREKIKEELNPSPDPTVCPECGSELEMAEIIIDAQKCRCRECGYEGFPFGKPTHPEYELYFG